MLEHPRRWRISRLLLAYSCWLASSLPLRACLLVCLWWLVRMVRMQVLCASGTYVRTHASTHAAVFSHTFSGFAKLWTSCTACLRWHHHTCLALNRCYKLLATDWRGCCCPLVLQCSLSCRCCPATAKLPGLLHAVGCGMCDSGLYDLCNRTRITWAA